MKKKVTNTQPQIKNKNIQLKINQNKNQIAQTITQTKFQYQQSGLYQKIQNQTYQSDSQKNQIQQSGKIQKVQKQSINLYTNDQYKKYSSNKPNDIKVQKNVKVVVQYPRTDSIRSNATLYPNTNQGGNTKVVRLIRDSNQFADTQRSIINSSNIKEHQFVRKIQTPFVYKQGQKSVKKSHQMNENVQNYTINHLYSNQDFNYQDSQMQVQTEKMKIINKVKQNEKGSPLSHLIYQENKQKLGQEIVSEDNVDLIITEEQKIQKNEQFNMSFHEEEKINQKENKNMNKKEYDNNQQTDLMKKLGIVKKVPQSKQQSKLRQDTNYSKITDRTQNSIFSNTSKLNREKVPLKQRGQIQNQSQKQQNQIVSHLYSQRVDQQQSTHNFNPFACTQQVNNKQPSYGSVSPEKQRIMTKQYFKSKK